MGSVNVAQKQYQRRFSLLRLMGFQKFLVLKEALKIALTSIWAHKLRSLLTLIGVIVGVASVMVVGSFISGLEVYVTENITSILGSHTFLVTRAVGQNMTREEWEKKWRTHKNITRDDYEAIASKAKWAKVVAADLSSTVNLKRKGRQLYQTSLNGCTAGMPELADINIQSGRFFQPFEVERSHQVCVIGWSVQTDIFPGEDSLGKLLKIKGTDFLVIGVLAKRGNIFGVNQDNVLYIPITSFQKAYGSRSTWLVRVKTEPGEAFEMAQEEVRRIVRSQHHLSPGQKDDFDIFAVDEINQAVSNFTSVVAMVVTPITCISLVVGGIVIMNIMLVSVTERTREIGIRKAVGARRRDLLLQFVMESAILGLIGGGAGVLFSYGLVGLIAAKWDLTLVITAGYIILSLGVSGGIGLLAGTYPAWKASKLDPIKALSYET